MSTHQTSPSARMPSDPPVSGETQLRGSHSRSEPVGVAAAEDTGPDTRPEVLGKYHGIAALGSGGMSRVHLAVVRGPAGFHKLVVLKELRASLSNSDQYLPMFLDEARLAARLNHPNVVQTNEVGQAGETYFIAMEYLDGQPLTNILRRTSATGGLPLPFALRIVADACAGLHHAHELTDFDGTPLDVVHRDVSPQNIFVTYDGQTKVVDFGVAKAAGRTVQTRVGVLKGKIRYMAPEQARGESVDRRADIFSLGVVLYEIVAVRRLWPGRDVDALQELRAGRIPASPKEFRPDLPEAVDRICRRALSVAPEERYATALEMQRDLEECLETLTPRVTPRAIGEVVSALFAEERSQIHAVIEQQLRRLESIAAGSGSSPHLTIPALTLGGSSISAPSSQASLPPARRWWSAGRVAGMVVAFLFAMLLGVSWALWNSQPRSAPQAVQPAVDVAPPRAVTPAVTSTAPPVSEPTALARTAKPRAVQAPQPWGPGPGPSANAWRGKLTIEPTASPPAAPQPRTPVAPAPHEDDPLGDRK